MKVPFEPALLKFVQAVPEPGYDNELAASKYQIKLSLDMLIELVIVPEPDKAATDGE